MIVNKRWSVTDQSGKLLLVGNERCAQLLGKLESQRTHLAPDDRIRPLLCESLFIDALDLRAQAQKNPLRAAADPERRIIKRFKIML